MTKHLLSATAALLMLSGVASAQIYPAPPPPVLPAPPPPAPVALPPPVAAPDTSTTTTTVAPNPAGDYRQSTVTKGVDENGNEVTKKETVREGIAGSSETHTTVKTDPDAGTVTKRTTTTTSPQ
jgi:hypothetical protein